MTSAQKIARILRVDKDVIRNLEEKGEALTGKKNVLDKIVEENRALVAQRLQFKELSVELHAEEIYQALVDKIKQDDLQLFRALGKPSFMLEEDVASVLTKIQGLLLPNAKKGFFLKKEKALEFLKKNPPQKVIDYLGYRNGDELIEREDVFDIFAAIRLFESREWFNDLFVKQYLDLTPNDFEMREVVFRALNQKWVGIAQAYLKQRYQNISHLKELGVVFAVPTELGMAGETTLMFSLALHYFHEIKFYSELFQRFARDLTSFGENVISVLKVSYVDKRLPETSRLRFLNLPSYLAKYDENDWRLLEPHISPEVLFWIQAEESLRGLNNLFLDKNIHVDFSFWEDLDWVGDYFKTATGIEVLVSFNFVDTTMSLMKEKELIKYLYHHQESLWNKIFAEYFGGDMLEEKMKESIIKGWFEM